LLTQYHNLLLAGEQIDMKALEQVQQQLESSDGWRLQQRVERTIIELVASRASELI
jgi:hypothetical protein